MRTTKILIFNPFGIGDVLFTTPLIRNLKENIKDLSLTYICNRRVSLLLENNTFVDKVIIFEKDEWRDCLKKSKKIFLKEVFNFLGHIRKERFDIVFDLSLNAKYGFFLKLAGIKIRIGYDFKKRGRFLTNKILLENGYIQKHVANYYLELLSFLNIKPKDYCFDVFLSTEDLCNMKEFLKNNFFHTDELLVAVCPGSGDSWGKLAYFKRWPKENFIELCNCLQNEFNAKILLLGSMVEKPLCDFIYKRLIKKSLNLAGSLNLKEFISILSLAKIVITNDGGPFHIAQGLKKKIIGFFGPVDEKVYGPYPSSDNIFVMKKNIDCRPCYRNFRFLGCLYNKRCLREIEVGEVVLAFKQLIF